jgi:hypothetical protein
LIDRAGIQRISTSVLLKRSIEGEIKNNIQSGCSVSNHVVPCLLSLLLLEEKASGGNEKQAYLTLAALIMKGDVPLPIVSASRLLM